MALVSRSFSRSNTVVYEGIKRQKKKRAKARLRLRIKERHDLRETVVANRRS